MRKRKLVDRPTYHPTKIVRRPPLQLENGVLLANVFVAVSCDPIAALTDQEKEMFQTETGKHLSADDWKSIESARSLYVWHRRNEDSGVSFQSLRENICKIQKAAASLKFLLDGPQDAALGGPDDIAWSYLQRDPHAMAWSYISESESPPFGHDEIYPAISMLMRRCHLALEKIDLEEQAGGWLSKVSPWRVLIDSLAQVFKKHNWPVTISKPKGGTTKLRLSTFGIFVKAIISTLPNEICEHHRGDTTLVNSISKALAKRT